MYEIFNLKYFCLGEAEDTSEELDIAELRRHRMAPHQLPSTWVESSCLKILWRPRLTALQIRGHQHTSAIARLSATAAGPRLPKSPRCPRCPMCPTFHLRKPAALAVAWLSEFFYIPKDLKGPGGCVAGVDWVWDVWVEDRAKPADLAGFCGKFFRSHHWSKAQAAMTHEKEHLASTW